MFTEPAYRLVRLRNGTVSVHSIADVETMHPATGPAAEAETLYADQLQLVKRLAKHAGEFVVWDIGLGAAANAIAVLNAIPGRDNSAGAPNSASAQGITNSSHAETEFGAPGEGRPYVRPEAARLEIHSFDHTLEPLRFALRHVTELGYPAGYEIPLGALLEEKEVEFRAGNRAVSWRVHLGDFPDWLAEVVAGREPLRPAPHAILFDPFSPAKNPAMWTAPLFSHLFRLLDPQRPCSLATYSRSTMVRVALLLAGFFVGAGHATGQKEETTVAANRPDLLVAALDRRWLERARRSDSAEPLWEPVYRRAKLSPETFERLQMHPQFS